MNRFQVVFDQCKSQGRAAIMPYMTAGDPSLQWTERLIDELIAGGADMIELGMPYSDPLADGPTVQAAGQRALAAGTTIDGVFETVSKVRLKHPNVPIGLLIYYNCIFRRGEQTFVEEAVASGLDGIIVPDLPPEESGNLRDLARAKGLSVVHLAAPTSTEERLLKIVEASDGFIYCVAVTGVTGARRDVSDELTPFLEKIRLACDQVGKSLPLAVGFGISTPDHAQRVGAIADGVIVGSALIDKVSEANTPEEGVAAGRQLIHSFKQSVWPNNQ